MCLISILPRGKEKYSKEVTDFLKTGFNGNKDGSGFMYKRDGAKQIHINKGFFNFDQLMKAIEILELKVEDELVVHHRIGTAGEISAENTHPFVISHVHDTIVTLEGITDKPCLVHNGMFSDLDDYERRNPKFSDTYAFVRYIMSNSLNLFRLEPKLFEKSFKGVLGWSRVCVMYPDRDLQMMGDFKEDNGYYHSHHGYKTYYNKYDDDIFSNNTKKSYVPKIFPIFDGVNSNVASYSTKDKKSNILDGSVIDITDFNYSHFIFQRKDIKHVKCYVFESYDENALINVLCEKKETYDVVISVSKEDLHNNYDFHPKKEYEAYYTEYLYILAAISPSKSLFKNIYHLLVNNRLKNPSYTFNVKNINVSRFTLINFYLSLANNHVNDGSVYHDVKSKTFMDSTVIKDKVIALEDAVN